MNDFDNEILPTDPDEGEEITERVAGRETYEWVRSLVGAVLVITLLFTFVVRLMGVDGHSMVPTLQDGDRLIVWMPFENRLTSWCKTPPLSEERVRLARKLGAQVGAWILEDEGELRQVCEEYRVDVVETTGSLKPDGWKENGK